MPIGNDSYVNNTLEVLKAFLVSSEKVYASKKKISGYGLKKEDLNKTPYEGFNQKGTKKHNASSKMFSERKEDLLWDYHIAELPSKERGKYYGITPIGISYFCEHSEEIDTDVFEGIFTHLKFFYEKGKPKKEESYLDKLENIIRDKRIKNTPKAEKYIKKEFQNIFSYFKVEHKELDYIHIQLTHWPTSGMEVLMSEFTYSKEEGGYHCVISDTNRGTLDWKEKEIDSQIFNYLLSKFLIKTFLHSLYIVCQSLKNLKEYSVILKSFNQEDIGVVKEFQKEINKAVKLYINAFELESKVYSLI